MKAVVDRDSVSMGDDVHPHAQVRELPDDTRVGEVVARTAEEYPPRGRPVPLADYRSGIHTRTP
ncbi:hypothetical protein [Nocardiopsis sp. CC223A]|uniref:hypothetical protein n=1 Tax=Nocardiopsis sp. CC223A TaxID=3044051 RepID=UPI00278BF74F|nr:hypothetical protein [Nocardiopsis sp. CC223A]